LTMPLLLRLSSCLGPATYGLEYHRRRFPSIIKYRKQANRVKARNQ
jgi:hypothetical protein